MKKKETKCNCCGDKGKKEKLKPFNVLFTVSATGSIVVQAKNEEEAHKKVDNMETGYLFDVTDSVDVNIDEVVEEE